jgi:MFS family permease
MSPNLSKLLPPTPALRSFALANLVNTVGSGLFITGGTLYFTRVIGLSLPQVGMGLSITIGAALLVMVPLGRIADRVGAKRVYLALLLLQSACMAAYTVVGSFAAFIVVAALSAVADRGINGTVGAVIHDLADGENRVSIRAYLRSVTNIGFAVGTLLAGVALQIGTAEAYRTVVFGNALMFLAAALLVLRVPSKRTPQTPPRPAGEPQRTVLKDRHYVAVSAANAALTLHFELLSFALPLWIVMRTDAPPATVSAVFVINTAMIVLLQVRASRRITSVADSVRELRVVGTLLVGSCVLMAITAHTHAWLTLGILVLWATTYTIAELFHSAVEFSLSFDLADDSRQGEYQSTFALARGIVRAISPALLSALVLDSSSGAGWIIVAVALGFAAALTAKLAASAAAARTSDPRTSAVAA